MTEEERVKFLRDWRKPLVDAANAIGGPVEAFRAEACLRAFQRKATTPRIQAELSLLISTRN